MDASALSLEITGLLLAGFLAVGAWHAGRRADPLREKTRQALDCAARLVALVAEIQQHRGMSGAWLAGDESFAARLPPRQQAVDRLLAALLEDAAREGEARHPCFVSNDVRLLRHRWRELVDGLRGSTPERSFQAHCSVVATLLEWLGAVGEARVEQPLAALAPPEAGRNFGHRLPALAECLGQARALGSAVAACGQCPPVSRVRLMFLASRAEFLLGKAAASDAEAPAKLEVQRAVECFVVALRSRLLAGEVTISAGDCFALGTRAVDGAFGWIEHERRALESALGASRGAPSAPRPSAGTTAA